MKQQQAFAISARLTFILTWRNALLLFRICNLCYYGRVVHGNEMLCTFGYTVLFLGKHYQAYYSPLAVHRLERPLFAALKSHFIRSMQSHSPGAYARDENVSEEKKRPQRVQHLRWQSDVHKTNKASVLRWSRVYPRCGCCKQHSLRLLLLLLLPLLLLLLLYAPASIHTHAYIHTLQYQLRDTVTVFTQRWRPSSCHRAMQAHYNNTPSTFLLSFSVQAEKPQSAHHSLHVGIISYS